MARHFGLPTPTANPPLARAREDDQGFCWRDVPHAIAIALAATALAAAIVVALGTISFGPPLLVVTIVGLF